ncbi:hypothetical protein pipiens_017551 [Culex pipiens pipiens]|uniref:Uncharacterized protein n=1 Tax=Culex pipiens pipiens TaxID=38569 RepID=A0ABD1CG07_CULPP
MLRLPGRDSARKRTATLEVAPAGDAELACWKGFYRSRHFTATGEERSAAGRAQSEATDARRGFPAGTNRRPSAALDITPEVPHLDLDADRATTRLVLRLARAGEPDYRRAGKSKERRAGARVHSRRQDVVLDASRMDVASAVCCTTANAYSEIVQHPLLQGRTWLPSRTSSAGAGREELGVRSRTAQTSVLVDKVRGRQGRRSGGGRSAPTAACATSSPPVARQSSHHGAVRPICGTNEGQRFVRGVPSAPANRSASPATPSGIWPVTEMGTCVP